MSGLQFRPELVRLIQQGRKTQTRRPVKGDKPARWKPGSSYAVQPGRGKPAVCRIVVDEVRMEPVGEVTFEDARREGFRTTAEFAQYWVRLYEPKWVDRLEGDDIDPALGVRFTERHAGRIVWVITFHLDTSHQPRYLSAAWPDYVTSEQLAMPGEPEALTEGELHDITRAARAKHDDHHAQEQRDRERDRALLAFEQRVADVRRRAHLNRVDIARELWMVERMIRERRDPPTILNRLQAAERRLDVRRVA